MTSTITSEACSHNGLRMQHACDCIKKPASPLVPMLGVSQASHQYAQHGYVVQQIIPLQTLYEVHLGQVVVPDIVAVALHLDVRMSILPMLKDYLVSLLIAFFSIPTTEVSTICVAIAFALFVPSAILGLVLKKRLHLTYKDYEEFKRLHK